MVNSIDLPFSITEGFTQRLATCRRRNTRRTTTVNFQQQRVLPRAKRIGLYSDQCGSAVPIANKGFLVHPAA